MASRPKNKNKTYDYYRVEILAALSNTLSLLMVSGFIVYDVWQRFKYPTPFAENAMLIVAFGGLIINLVSMRILNLRSNININIKGTFLEVLSDMLTSMGFIIAFISILTTGQIYVDPIISVIIGLFMIPQLYTLIKESVDISLNRSPPT